MKEQVLEKFARFLVSEKDIDLEKSIFRDLKRLNLEFGLHDTSIEFNFVNTLNSLFKEICKSGHKVRFLGVKRKSEKFKYEYGELLIENSGSLDFKRKSDPYIPTYVYSYALDSQQIKGHLSGGLYIKFKKTVDDPNVKVYVAECDDSYIDGVMQENHLLHASNFSVFIQNILHMTVNEIMNRGLDLTALFVSVYNFNGYRYNQETFIAEDESGDIDLSDIQDRGDIQEEEEKQRDKDYPDEDYFEDISRYKSR